MLVAWRRPIYVDQRIVGLEVCEINVYAVENVPVQQRMLDSGAILIGSARGNRDIEIQGVNDPMERLRQSLTAIDAQI